MVAPAPVAAYAPVMNRMAVTAGQPMSLPPRGYPQNQPQGNQQQYEDKIENPVKRVAEQPVSTFSIDVDTGSYTNVRQQIWQAQNIDPQAIRAEEFINYFDYQYPVVKDNTPFSANTLLTSAPWDSSKQLLRVALKAKDAKAASLPATNLVYLVDVSGSMNSPDKLQLVKTALTEMVDQLRSQDKVTIVTYSGNTAVVLPATSGSDKQKIKSAIAGLSAGGGTAGGAGIQMAYEQAKAAFINNGINRILLLTDGDFNVGVSDTDTLKKMVEQQRKNGIGLSTLGVGNYRFNDGLMEQLADVGDGKYSYLDSLGEARKVLIHEMSSTLATVARDVKIQVEFNPAYVQEYRLLGYDNRQLKREDFNNDQVDSGDIGAGHTVTAIYELTPVGAKPTLEPLRYSPEQTVDVGRKNHELAYLRLRYKNPNETTSQLIQRPVLASKVTAWSQAGEDMYWATAAASFAFKLQQRSDIPQLSWQNLLTLAKQGTSSDKYGQKQEMIALIEKARLQQGGE
jgi:Ca-activated chloride channel family protein